ncbi:divergent polysaccharide deacetylase family protein [Alisedimentitalea sp. MJ-SS2]|uniref:divergent polysaccharide deacteylase family protein n=1 Tax=Aliisedimentitalea sp. MJ-SS2 TaxID=3049795 RepID=UPI00291256A2|nr:divergent polysaccharide deacetylase family protein [Alisedimentitalea sp. MJ-SS2]MDU8929734.1 divergent polysaccharide deacetylase family protein [Alisedimentitalea sp. MJ-SS2]
MARGFLGGAALGLVVAVGGAVGLSLIAGGPVIRGSKPEATAVDVPAGSEFNGARDDTQASLPASEPVAAPGSAPRVTAPEPDTLASLEGADTRPSEQPQPGSVGQAPSVPTGDAGGAPQVTAATRDAPVQTGTQHAAPKPPTAEPELSISTEPSQPQAPLVETQDSAFAAPADPEPAVSDTPDPVEVSEPTPEPDADTAPAPAVQVDAPAEPQAPQTGQEDSPTTPVETTAPTIDPTPDTTAVVPADPAPAKAVQDNPVIEVEPEPATQDTEADKVDVAGSDPQATGVPAPGTVATPDEQTVKPTPAPASQVAEAEPDSGTAEPDVPSQPDAEAEPGPLPVAKDEPKDEQVATIRIGKPATNLLERNTGVQTRRLPTLGAGIADNGGATAAESGGEKTSAMPPIKKFAVDFQGPADLPKMAIVLIDEGEGPVGVEALSTFPYPLSFAVDASRVDAAEVMARYRSAGFEVLAMVALEKGSKPSDVEVAMPVLLSRVPEAVGVMEAPGDGIQFDRKVSDQVARILSDSGHGLLLFPKGLNTAQKLAAKNGVPSAAVFRDVDGKGQKTSAIRRFLNYGALNAANEGGVVMVARLRPDTVTALLLWGLEDRARQITLAPISQLLTVQP